MKRTFDIVFALLILLLCAVPLIILVFIAAIDCKGNGIFSQKRIGQYSKPFTIYKLETYNKNDKSISKIGHFLRKYKLDEMPQLINILKNDMSVVGPRPDVVGYVDSLIGNNRNILKLKPGLTGPASIKYINESQILSLQTDKKKYNDEVIFPDKIKLNLQYYHNHNFFGDIKIVFQTAYKLITH